MDIHIGHSDYYSIKSTTSVKLKEEFIIYDKNEEIKLEVEIIADFGSIPENYREIFLNMLTTKYLNRVNFSENSFSECRIEKKKSFFKRLFRL